MQIVGYPPSLADILRTARRRPTGKAPGRKSAARDSGWVLTPIDEAHLLPHATSDRGQTGEQVRHEDFQIHATLHSSRGALCDLLRWRRRVRWTSPTAAAERHGERLCAG